MKTVFSTSELPHIWASQTQEHGRNSNESLYFRGDTIFSYGSHFPIAKILDNGSVLLTNRRYSNTTASHISKVRSAVSHKNIVYCFNPLYSNLDNVLRFCNDIIDIEDKLKNTRIRQSTREKLMSSRYDVIGDVRVFCEAVGEDLDELITQVKRDTNAADIEKIMYLEHAIECGADKPSTPFEVKDIKKISAIAQKNAKRKALEGKKAKAKSIKEWLKGKRTTSSLAADVDIALRFLSETNEVETSWGAVVPAPKAQALYEVIKKRAGKKSLDLPTETIGTIGAYNVNNITDEGVTIGCHFIPMEEVDRFARVMGWDKI